MTSLSVVMPIYNAGAKLDESLLNVRNQTFRDLEIIVLDNCSTDDTFDRARKHAAEDSRVKVVRQVENIGMWPNFADGLKRGTSDFLAYRAHDDFSSLDYFECLMRATKQFPRAVLAAGSVNRVWPDGRTAQVRADFRSRSEMIVGAPASWFYGVWRREYLASRFAHVDSYPYVGGIDFLILYGALVSGQVACDPDALFTQRAPAGKRSYLTPDKMPPKEQWRFRSIFKSYCARDNARLPPRDRIRFALMPFRFTEARGRKIHRLAHASFGEWIAEIKRSRFT